MLELYELLAQADELVIVSPVFFSGPPAPMTALLDRLQPFFWEWLALRAAGDDGRQLTARKRSATLHVIGEGLDKNGYVALVSKVRSALAVAGFQLERVLDWVGRIDADGTIVDEAIEYRLPPLGVPLVASDAYLLPAKVAEGGQAGEPAPKERPKAPERQRDSRPKLDLSGGNRGSKSSGNAGKSARPSGNRNGKQGSNGNRNNGGSRSGNGSARNQKNGKRRG